MLFDLGGKDEVLLDPHPLSSDHTVSQGLVAVSDDGKLVAYGTRQGGEDERVIEFLEVEGRRRRADRLPKGHYFSFDFTPDNSGLYYSKFTPAGSRVYYHAMAADPASDREIFGAGFGPQHIISTDLSSDGRYLVIQVAYGAGGKRTDVYFQDLAAKGPVTPIVNDTEAVFTGRIAGDRMFLYTNWKEIGRASCRERV